MISPSKKRDWILRPHTKTIPIPIPNPIPIPITNPRNFEDKIGVSRSTQLMDREAMDRRRLKEAAMFMEDSLMEEPQDRDTLLRKISKLEYELQNYQHNMGLLLIEKRKLESTFEEQRQSFIETEELLKQERTAHLMASSEIEKLTENLKKVPQKGKQSVSEVNREKALMKRENNLEKEWEALKEEKEKLENLIVSNKERLKNENFIAQEYIQKELESLRLKKTSFEASMERERLVFSEKTRNERNQMLRDFEREKQIKLEKMEHDHNRQYLEEQKLESQKEVDKLNTLVKKMKDQSKGVKEVLEKHVKCRKCGDDINFSISELQLLQDIQEASDKAVDVPEIADKVEIPEASLCSELKTVPGGRGVKPKRGARAFSVKKVPDVSEVCDMDDKGVEVPEVTDRAVEIPEASLFPELKTVPGGRGAKPKRGARACSVKKVPDVSEVSDMDDKAVEVSEVTDKAIEIPEASLCPELKTVPGGRAVKPKRGARACSVKNVPDVSEVRDMDDKVVEVPEVADKAVEIPEASLCPELKTVPGGGRAVKPKRGARACSVKNVPDVSEVRDMDVAEVSLHSELKNVPRKRVAKPKRGTQANSVKEDSEDAKLDQPIDVPACINKPVGAVTSEEDQVSSVMKGVSKKRRQTVTQEPEVGAGRRYGLRQRNI